jgi:hypothetical protein
MLFLKPEKTMNVTPTTSAGIDAANVVLLPGFIQ